MQVEELTWLLRNAQQSTLQTARLALLPASALYQLRLAPDDVNRLLKVLEHKGPVYDGRTFRELVERELSELRDHVDVDGRYEATGEDHRIIPARHPRDRAVSFNRQGRADELMPAFPLLPMEHEDGIYLLDPPEASDLIVEQRPWDWSYRSARETRARQRYRGDEPSGTIDQRWYRAHARAADVPELVDARIRWLEDAARPLTEREPPGLGYIDCLHCGATYRDRAGHACPVCRRRPQEVLPVVVDVGCQRCGYRWVPRVEGTPVRCPRCQSRYWNGTMVREQVHEPPAEGKGARLHCAHCTFTWSQGRDQPPKRCPRCQSRVWRGE